MIIAKNRRILSESCTIPDQGSIKRVGNVTTFTITVTFTTDKIDSMQTAKSFFNSHRDRMARILSRYCDLVALASKNERPSEIFIGGAVVKKLMGRLGFIDED